MRGISLGLGFTNACDRSCDHCYRPAGEPRYLTTTDVARCLDVFDVGSANFGTGENILNPQLGSALDLLHERGVRTSLTSNGLSLLELDRVRLGRLHDVEVSFDFATREGMDAFRGEGAWDRAVSAVERCVAAGLEVTVLAVMMRTNWDQLADVARLAASLGANFRVNVYQPVHGAELAPSFEQFWEGFRLLFDATRLVTCTEPVVAAVLAAERGEALHGGPPCGCGHASIRLTPDKTILPCVYWPRPQTTLADLEPGQGPEVFEGAEFVACRTVPRACQDCSLLARCGGGCPSRRALVGAVDEPDPYCPMRVETLPTLGARPGEDKELLHAANVCTTIVQCT